MNWRSTTLDGNDESGLWGANAKDCEIDGFQLKLTCSAFPEQYDVYKDGVQVGYLRLRHGSFRVDYPGHHVDGGRTIYRAEPRGDGWFEDDEREGYLKKAIEAIQAEMSLHSV